ncbi:MAG: beta-lactamase family protein [Gemmatimonadota bacterium]|nr:beta-lactamase family protein [Gemmatimonadota bacterium]
MSQLVEGVHAAASAGHGKGRGTWAVGAAFAAVAVVLQPPALLAQPTPTELQGLGSYVERAMADWAVPGLSVAVVKDDTVVFARGFGTRTLGEDQPVDENTVFAIGSATKAFTTAALGMLVDEGLLEWDRPVIEILPWFQMHDPWVTREITVRDLVTHRSGLPGGRSNLLWYASRFDRREIVRRIRFLEPTASFRSEYQYQNLMFLTAGLVVEEIARMSWASFVASRILEPLGMERSLTSVKPLARMDNVASPHAQIQGEWRTLPWRDVDTAGPAGSINSTAADMAQWIRLHMGDGGIDGTRLISAAQALEMRTPQFVVDPDRAGSMNALNQVGAGIHFFTYGLGWQLFDYRGKKVMWHGGNIDGMAAVVAMIPEVGLGLVILTNRNGGTVRDALMLRIFDAFLGGVDRDWSRELLAFEQRQRREQEPDGGTRETGPRTHALTALTGWYEDRLLGRAHVVERGEGLGIELETGLAGTLTHRYGDVFDVIFDDIGLWATFPSLQGAEARFETGFGGGVTLLRIEGLGEFGRL